MSVTNLADHKLALNHDGALTVATGKNRNDTHWKNKRMQWSALLDRLSRSVQTPETLSEFLAKRKTEQDEIKDVGGFVGGSLREGRRKAENVQNRQLITLDADFAPTDFLEGMDITLGAAYAVYSTHKHSPAKPRLRLLIPLLREVSPDEYEAIARKLAEKIGIDYFDETTYEPNRMMFWPSHPYDVEPVFDYYDTEWLDPDAVLSEYPDWTDMSFWPVSSRAREKRQHLADKQADPTEKDNIIGAFCRTYTIRDAIERFLANVYTACDGSEDRYTYTEGSTSGGLVIYDNKFAFSHHATDPASGKLCNAFDLVRIHKYGSLDDDEPENTATTRRPSYKAMVEFCQKDPEVRKKQAKAKKEEALRLLEDEDDWEAYLELDKKGHIMNTLNNARVILQYDPDLKGIVFNELADNLELTTDAPWVKKGHSKFWRDADDAQLESYFAERYAEFSKNRITTAITKVADDRSYHPIRQFLEALPEWDGVRRVDTLLVDYLGAEDTPYVRAVMRKTLCAAVKRVEEPGIKFDTVLVLRGGQGIGKSTFFAKLGGKWFSDSLNLKDTDDKTAAEKLQGVWIVEIQEMAGLGSASVKALRSFITSQNDRYRASYGRRVSEHKRQCILVGTTNAEDGYLNDVEGGRRFWPVDTPGGDILKPWDLTEEDVQQIWAEVKTFVAAGESLILEGKEAEAATSEQKAAMITDPREELVRAYLDVKLPAGWYERSVESRKTYFTELDDVILEGTVIRERVCPQEIWVECFHRNLTDMTIKDTYAIKRIMARMEGWEGNERFYPGAEYGRQRGYERTGHPRDNPR